MFLIFGLCSGLAALGLLAGAAWSYFKTQRTMQSRVQTTGTVVALAAKPGNRRNIYCPVVEFTTPAGEKIQFTSEFGSNPASDKVGDVVRVRYDSADPQKAEVESDMTTWLGPLVFGCMGLIACCLSVAFLGFYGFGISP